MPTPIRYLFIFCAASGAFGFHVNKYYKSRGISLQASNDNDLSSLLGNRLPTSVDDQVRQAAESLKRASEDGFHRHSVRLLLPVIGATELDDWPGGARQMMEAAYPLVTDIMNGMVDGDVKFQQTMLDKSDGLYAILGQAPDAKQDSCSVLLPSADNVKLLQGLDEQVGAKRDYLLVNTQWKRKSDFGGFFGSDESAVAYVEGFAPTFSLTNLICEGDSVRVLRNYPNPWRVFLRSDEDGEVDWIELGTKEVVEEKPSNWSSMPQNQIVGMIQSAPNYKPKNPAERAAVAFNFIKDTL